MSSRVRVQESSDHENWVRRGLGVAPVQQRSSEFTKQSLGSRKSSNSKRRPYSSVLEMTHFIPPRLLRKEAAALAKPASEYVLNRNPRNLEKLCIAYKPSGWWLERPGRNYWHKLFIERNSRNITAYIKHYTGTVPITASTKEWAIKKHLYSSTDRAAYVNLGRILALRCLQSGLTEMICDHQPPEGSPETNVQAFLVELLAGGVSLTEPERYEKPRPSDVFRPEQPWKVHD